VVAALARGLLDAADVGQGVGRFVQQGPEDVDAAADEAFPSREHFGRASPA
jgi:hypothetical protein